MRKSALSIVPIKPSRCKVIEFTEETALRFIRKAYPEAKITVTQEDRYEGNKTGVYYEITVKGAGHLLKGSSSHSLKDAFRDLVQSGGLRW